MNDERSLVTWTQVIYGLHALSLLSIAGAAAALFACVALFRTLDQTVSAEPLVWMGNVLVAVCPLYWLTAARPLSDAAGLGAALAVQAIVVAGSSPRALVLAAACTGFAVGIRSQVVWLTVPVLAWGVARLPRADRGRRRRVAGDAHPRRAGITVLRRVAVPLSARVGLPPRLPARGAPGAARPHRTGRQCDPRARRLVSRRAALR